jgi:flavodoxin I
MAKMIGLIYGSSSSLTEQIAQRIKSELGTELDVYKSIKEASVDDFKRCNRLILGIPTYDYGELQMDWQRFFPRLDEIDFSGKTVAIFGLGDQVAYPDTFLNAVGTLGDKIVERGGRLVGRWPKETYEYSGSFAERDGMLMGLGIDINTQGEMTDSRIKGWAAQIKNELNLPEHRVARSS